MFILKLARLLVLLIFGVASSIGGNAQSFEYSSEYTVSLCSYETSAEYTLESGGDCYILKCGESESRFSEPYEAINSLPDGAELKLCALSCGGGVIERSLTLSGELTVTSGNLAILGGTVTIDGISLELKSGGVIIKDGELLINGGELHSYAAEAISLSSTSSSLLVSGGEIYSENASAIRNTLGRVIISGGKISSRYTNCVYNCSELIISGGSLTSELPEISSSVPIFLSHGGDYFSERLRVEYREGFKKGKITPVFLGASAAQAELISVSDSSGEEYPLSFTLSSESLLLDCFLSVNLPYEVKFYHGDELLLSSYLYDGEALSQPSVSAPTGYSLFGWYTDYTLSERYAFGMGVSGDLSLFSEFRLIPPSFEISSLSFTYDKASHLLAFDRIYHPCLDEGKLYYKWYKDGAVISSKEMLELSKVSDSGSYKCELTFTYNGDFSYSVTPELNVEIFPKLVEISPPASKEYTGEILYPDIAESELYYSDFKGGVEAGVYEVILTMHDGENYRFSEGVSPSLTLNFSITRAKNYFTEISVAEEYFIGTPFDAVFRTRFGTPRLLFSLESGQGFSDKFPSEAGEYYLMASVDPCESFEGVTSSPIPFSLKEDSLISLDLLTPPTKLSYLAFEFVSLEGISLEATYLSGVKTEVPASLISVEYKNSYGLSVTDRSVTLSYLDLAIPLSVSVSPCDYDISGIEFSDKSLPFCGKWQTLSAAGKIVGKDGKELLMSLRGGGVNAGRYTVSLEFTSQSLNYNTPPTLYRTLDITPLEVVCEYSNLEFIYDGSVKAPSAAAYGVNSLPLSVRVESVFIDAGSYTVSAVLPDGNYRLKNPSVSFVIKKAPLNLSGARLSESSFIYDGKPKSVSLVGLPEAVYAVGYLDSVYTEAGDYLARVSLSFDERNYYLDSQLSYKWSIAKAEYDMSGIEFLDTEVVYDGKSHTPRVVGRLPVGADGSSPEYRFLNSVCDVTGDGVSVTAVFSTDSKNYNAPKSITRSVLITPLEIEVVWEGLRQTFSGASICATAASELCEIEVTGGGVDAGSYTVTAAPKSRNYSIKNALATLIIEKCQNEFLSQPSILSAYFGDRLIKEGSTKYGNAVFSFYLDKALTQPIDEPYEVGEYYMTVSAPEGINYLAIVSEPIKFSILKVLPIGLMGEVKKEVLLALDRIASEDIEVSFVNNNGTFTKIPFSKLKVSYRSGDSLRYGDNEIGISAGGFYTTLGIRVARRSYDMEEARWENTHHTYDGEEKTANVVGLPSGVSVKKYILNKATNAGEYRLSCIFEYDRENYNDPKIAEASLVIYKKELKLPNGAVYTYDKEIKRLSVADTDYYIGGEVYGTESGKYRLALTLRDSENYCFSGGDSSVTLEILPREITLRVNQDFDSYTLIDGSIIDDDDIGVKYEQIGNFVYISLQNPNYKATVIPRNVNDKSGNLWILLLIAAVAVFLFLLGYFIYKKRQEIRLTTAGAHGSADGAANTGKEQNLTATLMCVDRAYADSLISNSLAKTLRKKSESEIESSGRGLAKISLGAISSAFESGDLVDINALKEKMLISSEAGKIRITADGVIDKPLKVYADSFAPSALKMIALTGGESFTVKKKRKI